MISDDASRDDTEQAVAVFLDDPRVSYSRNEHNLGRVGNYHHILYNHAKGDWYLNVDGDDEITDRNFIGDAVELISRHDRIVMVSAGCQRLVHGKTDYVISSSYPSDVQVIKGAAFFMDIPSRKAWLSHLTTIYHTEKAKSISFYRENILSSDYESLFRLSLLGDVGIIHRLVGAWHIHDNNESVNLKVDTKQIMNNVKYIENTAQFARAYLPQQTVNHWRSSMLAKYLRENMSYLIKSRPVNWDVSMAALFKAYPWRSAVGLPVIFLRKFARIITGAQ